MTGTYAANTEVSTGRSREEIENTLRRYGADEFAYATTRARAIVGFVANGRQVRFTMPLPDRNSEEFVLTPTKQWRRADADANKAWEKACRQRWRALALVVKAKLEAVQAGIVTFEQEFGMHMVLPGGQTVAEMVIPEIAAAYQNGEPPRLMLGAS